MSIVYLIPSLLAEDAIETIPLYVINAIEGCQVIFAENERTARRFLKKIKKEIVNRGLFWCFRLSKKNKKRKCY